MNRLLIVLSIGLLSLALVQAQEPEIDLELVETDVYVTTQFNLNFREGPGLNWNIIEMLGGGITMPAIGRTANTGWVQVIYEGQLGWVSTRYIVWSGDIISLPIDGRFFDNYIRRVGVLAYTVRETPYYVDWVDPSTQVGVLPYGVWVEVIGRLGYRNDLDFNVMILYQDELYWLGAWNLNLEAGRYRSVLDNSYRNAYSRLAREFSSDISNGERRLSSIENVWRSLQRGEAVNCSRLPALLLGRTVSNNDLNAYQQFGSVASAFDTAIGHVNTAIAMFEDACNREDAFITQQDVREALDVLSRARQNFNIARSLLISLQRRDPLLGDL
jgi:SH3 domain-containing protein